MTSAAFMITFVWRSMAVQAVPDRTKPSSGKISDDLADHCALTSSGPSGKEMVTARIPTATAFASGGHEDQQLLSVHQPNCLPFPAWVLIFALLSRSTLVYSLAMFEASSWWAPPQVWLRFDVPYSGNACRAHASRLDKPPGSIVRGEGDTVAVWIGARIRQSIRRKNQDCRDRREAPAALSIQPPTAKDTQTVQANSAGLQAQKRITSLLPKIRLRMHFVLRRSPETAAGSLAVLLAAAYVLAALMGRNLLAEVASRPPRHLLERAAVLRPVARSLLPPALARTRLR
jgi:hypothetical protein